ncbi:helix-turn-helix transcriptional regulator [Streptomyces sp. NPDC020362]|uniref:helix-turn-helix transcriptional regulator n=1 Tax=unclassified Streptomyces TaxID=2593676 RepID=UPI0033D7A4E7
MDVLEWPILGSEAAELFMALSSGRRPGEVGAQAWLELKSLGLVAGTPDTPRLRDPSLLLRRAESELHQKAAEVEAQVVSCREQLSPLVAAFAAWQERSDSSSSGFEVLSGFDEINAVITEALRDARTEVLTAQPGGGRSASTLEDSLLRETELIQRGIRVCTLYQHTARFNPATRYYVERISDIGGEVRTLDEFFDRLIIVDQTVAFIPCVDDRSSALALRHPAVVRFLRGVFDRAWIRGIEFSAEEPREISRQTVDSTRLTVARLLMQGHTDDVGARRAGLSIRNYREHVKSLMNRLGAQSRADLGFRIARSGLLDGMEGLDDGE